MMSRFDSRPEPQPASLIVFSPTGDRHRTPLLPLPFRIGRQTDNHLVLLDNRISRHHARIVAEAGAYFLEDLKSRHGVYVNGARVTRQQLLNADRVHFGPPDSYRLVFTYEEDTVQRLLGEITGPARASAPAAPELARLSALVEVARAIETSLSTDDILAAVVDAALKLTGTERGFLLLTRADTLEVRIARDRHGQALRESELRVPRRLIREALVNRRELLSMDFSPQAAGGILPQQTVADLELRAAVCVPLVRIRAAADSPAPRALGAGETAGALYLDSRAGAADLSWGDRELLEALALEASTILENARLLELARSQQRLEEELKIARQIQDNLLPRRLPDAGWFRAEGSSFPSYQVGGDYFDVRQLTPERWALVVADVAGKGVSSALLASLLQGAFLAAPASPEGMPEMMRRLNRFLGERTEGGNYATLFYCMVDAAGSAYYVNAGHCAPLVVRPGGGFITLSATGLPVGLFEEAEYSLEQLRLEPASKIVIYSDGLSEAQNKAGEFFGQKRIRDTLRDCAGLDSRQTHARLTQQVTQFSLGTIQADDITLLVAEYQPY